MELIEIIRKDDELNTLLMRECDICFYKQNQDIAMSENGEVYSMSAKAFAVDGSGGEFVILEDGSVGLISSEGSVGRVADSIKELMEFLLHAGNVFDFTCKYIYKNESILKKFCDGYLSYIREDYKKKGMDFDSIRKGIAGRLGVTFTPENLYEYAMKFYKAAKREPLFTCKFNYGEDEYTCDGILCDIVGDWERKLMGIRDEEII